MGVNLNFRTWVQGLVKGVQSERRERKGKTQSETREIETKTTPTTKSHKKKLTKKNKIKQSKETQDCQRVSHVWSNSSLLEIGPSSAAEERVWVVSKYGCYMFS